MINLTENHVFVLKHDDITIYLSKRISYNVWSIHPDFEFDNEKHIIIEAFDEEESVIDIDMMLLRYHVSIMEGVLVDHYATFNTFDNLDIKYYGYTGNTQFDVITYHGDITITNSKGQVKPLKGMYSKMKYTLYSKSRLVRFSDFRMFRDRYFTKRYDKCHSHVQGSMLYHFSEICLGNADIKNQMRRGKPASKVDHYENLLYVDSFIKWESLEGGPYNNLEKFYTQYQRPIAQINDLEAELYRIISSLPQKDLDIAIYSDKLGIDNNQIYDLLSEVEGVENNTYDGYAFDADHIKLAPVTIHDDTDVYFRGEKLKIYIGITEEDKEDIIEHSKSIFNNINKTLIEEVGNRVNNIINTYFYDDTENTENEHVSNEEGITVS